MLEKPKSVKYAEIAVWGSVHLSILITAIANRMEAVTLKMGLGALVGYALYCLLTHKLGQGRNWARYVLTVLGVLSVAILLGGDMEGVSDLGLVVYWALVPMDFLIIYWLFKSDSSEWFKQVKRPAAEA